MTDKKLIMTVCRGNISRSPVAEEIIRQQLALLHIDELYEVTSRGLQGTEVDPEPVKYPNLTHYGQIYQDSLPALTQLGIDFTGRVSTPIDTSIAEQASLILAMDKKVLIGLQTLYPETTLRMRLFSTLLDSETDI